MPRTKKIQETTAKYVTRQPAIQYRRPRRRALKPRAKLLVRHIVADPKICHGKPTFRGTRIMMWQVIEMLAEGLLWDETIYECHNRISREAIAEAIWLSGQAFLKHADEFVAEPVAA